MLRRRRSQGIAATISSGAIDKVLDSMAKRYGREFCLDVGSGADEAQNFQTVDANPASKPDYLGDIRCLFAPSSYYEDKADDYPGLLRIPSAHFMLVRLKHVIEHVEWIYQEPLLRWVLSVLADEGVVIIDTPNLEYICKMYLRCASRQTRGQAARYPYKEHPDLNPEIAWHMQRWVNFKLYSGCSPGDYHHTCYDKRLLGGLLNYVGYERIAIWNGQTLRAIAYKAATRGGSLDEIIEHITG